MRWKALDRLLVVRPDNLGDVLLAGPAVAALRAAAPAARLDLRSPAGAPGAALLPDIDEAVVARVSWQQIATTVEPPDTELVTRLAARRYDAAVVLTSFSQSPWPAGYALQRAGVPVRAGTSKEFGGTALPTGCPLRTTASTRSTVRCTSWSGWAWPPRRGRCARTSPRRAGRRPARRWPRQASPPTSRTPWCCRAPRALRDAGPRTGSRDLRPAGREGDAGRRERARGRAGPRRGRRLRHAGGRGVGGRAGRARPGWPARRGGGGRDEQQRRHASRRRRGHSGGRALRRDRGRGPVPAPVRPRGGAAGADVVQSVPPVRCPFALECLDVAPETVVAAAADLAG